MGNPGGSDRRIGSCYPFLILVILAFSIAACSGSAAATPVGGGAQAPALQPAPAASVAPATRGGDTTGGGGTDSGGTGQQALVDDTKIVRTGSLQVTVTDPEQALAGARDAIRGMGGYIGASQQERKDDSIVATVTYRIPVARWEDALAAIRKLGTEVAEQTNATEVTGQLVDLDARIRNLKASETALVGYAEKAPKVSDLLEIEARLTETRGEIERLTAQQATLTDQAALGTLTVTFGTQVVAVTEAAAKWDPAAEVDRASATLIGIGQGIASFLIVFAIVWLPILAALAVVAVIGLAIARRLGWRRPPALPPLDPRVGPPPASAEQA